MCEDLNIFASNRDIIDQNTWKEKDGVALGRKQLTLQLE